MKRLLLALFALAVGSVIVALPVTAAVPGATGVRLSIITAFSSTAPPRYIEENTPFHIRHGFICNATPLYVYDFPAGHPDEGLNGQQIPGAGTKQCLANDFRLWVDGKRTADFVVSEYYGSGSTRVLAARWNVTNFPDGLPAGTYLFRWEFWVNHELSTVGAATGTRTVIVCPATTAVVPLGGPCPA